MMLDKKKKYLQIALNSTLQDAQEILSSIPLDERIIIEVGTPLIKNYGTRGIREIRNFWEQRAGGLSSEAQNVPDLIALYKILKKGKRRTQFKSQNLNNGQNQKYLRPYIVADLKCMDRGLTEVIIAKDGGASAATALGHAPIETLNAFIEKCQKLGIDSMIDMMNVDYPLTILRKLKKLPNVVMLHRGVDEEDYNLEKQIPYYEIQRIKSNYDILVSVAGGDTIQEVQRAIFNDVDIVVLWRAFYRSSKSTAGLAKEFLKEIR